MSGEGQRLPRLNSEQHILRDATCRISISRGFFPPRGNLVTFRSSRESVNRAFEVMLHFSEYGVRDSFRAQDHRTHVWGRLSSDTSRRTGEATHPCGNYHRRWRENRIFGRWHCSPGSEQRLAATPRKHNPHEFMSGICVGQFDRGVGAGNSKSTDGRDQGQSMRCSRKGCAQARR